MVVNVPWIIRTCQSKEELIKLKQVKEIGLQADGGGDEWLMTDDFMDKYAGFGDLFGGLREFV